MGKMNIYEDFKAPIIDFIDNAHRIPNLIGAVLFGSVLTGDISKKSDIDILLITESEQNPEVGEESRIAHEITSEISKKYKLEHSFSIAFYNIKNGDMEPDFLWEVAKEGLIIWARPAEIISKNVRKNLLPKLLCKYTLKGLTEKDKRAVIRRLYESRNKLIDKKEEKIAPGVLLIDAEKEKELVNIFNNYRLTKYSIKKVWTN